MRPPSCGSVGLRRSSPVCACDTLVCVRLLPTWFLHYRGHDYGPGDVVFLEPDHASQVVARGHGEIVQGATVGD